MGPDEEISGADSVEELKKLILEERAARLSLEAQLVEEREERVKVESKSKRLMMQMEEVYRRMESEGEGHVNKLVLKILEEKKDKEKMANDFECEEENLTNTLLSRLSDAQREREESEKALKDMKQQIAAMNLEREKLAIMLEREEEAVTNTLLTKLRILTKEKEAAEIALVRSRSSSISDANSSVCGEGGSSVAGSFTSEGKNSTSIGATRDDDARSEISFLSNQASASESESVQDSKGDMKGKRLLPPPPITVGGVLPSVIGEDD